MSVLYFYYQDEIRENSKGLLLWFESFYLKKNTTNVVGVVMVWWSRNRTNLQDSVLGFLTFSVGMEWFKYYNSLNPLNEKCIYKLRRMEISCVNQK